MQDAIARALAPAGFDIVHELAYHGARAVLVGNTRALWPSFVRALATDPALHAEPDPLDRYTERALARFAPVYFAHRPYDGAYLPFQRLAADAGLGTLSPTHLVIHPVYGPWFALRALVVIDGPLPAAPAPAPPACQCDAACTTAFARACAATGPDAWRAWLAVRDACPVGRGWRYSDDQLAYHYTKDRRHLR